MTTDAPDKDKPPCADKLAFDSRKAAQTAATVSQWRRGPGPKLSPYHCRHCGLWHLTTV